MYDARRESGESEKRQTVEAFWCQKRIVVVFLRDFASALLCRNNAENLSNRDARAKDAKRRPKVIFLAK